MNTTANQVIVAIQDISVFKNVKENLELVSKVAKSIECGTIRLDELKTEFIKKCSYNNRVIDLFNVLFLKNGTITTIYLIKGLEVILSDKSITELLENEKEYVYCLHKNVEENDVKGVFVRVLRMANVFYRYKSILTLKHNKR